MNNCNFHHFCLGAAIVVTHPGRQKPSCVTSSVVLPSTP